MENVTREYFSFPGVVSVGYVKASALSPNIAMKSEAGMPVAVLAETEWVRTWGEIKLKSTITHHNNGTVEEATLEFFTDASVPMGEHLAWVCECADRRGYLLGCKEGPYPTVEADMSKGNAGSERNGTTVKVACKGARCLFKTN